MKRLTYGIILIVTLILVVIPMLSACAQPAKVTTNTLKVGSLRCLTGWFSPMDAEEQHELLVVSQMINDKGGISINGQQYNIEIVTEDAQSTTDGARTAATKLVFDDKVKFVIETLDIFTAGATQVFEQNKVIHVSPYNTLIPGAIGPDTPYKFIGWDSMMGATIGIFKALSKEYPNVKKYAQVGPDDGSIAGILPVYDSVSQNNGFTRIGDPILYPNEMIDFSSIATKINAISGIDCIIQTSGIEQGIIGIVKSLRALGNTKPYVCTTNSQLKDFISIIGTSAASNLISLAILSGSSDNPPIMKEFIKAVETKYGPSPFVGSAANSLYILAQAIKAAQSLDPTAVKDKWESMDNIDTLYGPGKMGGDKTYGIKHHGVSHPMPVQLVKDGQVVSGGYLDITVP